MSESTRCAECDDARHRDGTPQKVGQPCDICDGRGYDYLGRLCRHRHAPAPFGGDDMPNEDELEGALLRAARGELDAPSEFDGSSDD